MTNAELMKGDESLLVRPPGSLQSWSQPLHLVCAFKEVQAGIQIKLPLYNKEGSLTIGLVTQLGLNAQEKQDLVAFLREL